MPVELNTPSHEDTQPVVTMSDNPRTARFLLILTGLGLLAGVSIVLCGLAISLLPRQIMEVPVSLTIDGGTQIIQTRAKNVADLLLIEAIQLNEGDVVTPGLNSLITADMAIQVERSRSVSVALDGQSRLYRTHLTAPAEIIASAGITLAASDRVTVDGTLISQQQLSQWPVPANQISILRAVPLVIMDGTRRIDFETTGVTVGEALFEAGISLFLADEVEPDSNAQVSPGMEITIYRSKPVLIIADGSRVETRVIGDTVGDALARAGLLLVGQDYTVPDTDIALQPGIRIRVIRVTEDVVIEEETQPYERVFQADAGLELDQRAVVQAGQNGVVQTSIRVRYENEIEVSRTVESSAVVQETLNEVIAYGTNIVLRTVDTPDGPRQYWRRIRMYATSYHPAALGGDNVTATGDILQKGIVGGDRGIMPFGTLVYVPGYGVGKRADTGALVRRLRIDLGYSDADWVSWSREVDVYLLTPVSENIEYLLPSE